MSASTHAAADLPAKEKNSGDTEPQLTKKPPRVDSITADDHARKLAKSGLSVGPGLGDAYDIET